MRASFALCLLLAATLTACSDDSPGAPSAGASCTKGKVEPCPCAGSTVSGAQTCLDNGTFGACEGCPAVATGGSGGAGGTGLLGGAGGAASGASGQSGSGQGNQGGQLLGGSGPGGGGPGGSGQAGEGQGGTGVAGNTAAGSGGSLLGGSGGTVSGSSGQGGSNPTCGQDPAADSDKDGWTPEQGDCNDCDPYVNPGAIDLVEVDEAGNVAGSQVDNDCDGAALQASDKVACDAGLAVEIADAFDAAKSIGLCNVKVEEMPADPKQKKWGVLKAGFNKISGGFLQIPVAPKLEAGILDGFGPASKPREGVRLLGMSSGVARAEGQPGYDPNLCSNGQQYTKGPDSWPPGFPKQGTCGETGAPNDGIAYDLKIRVPTNARSLSFNFRFYSCEYPQYTCDQYNDVFAVLMTPSPLDPSSPMHDQGSNSADIAFDEKNNVIGVNNQTFFTACEPDTQASGYSGCKAGNGSELAGTSFVGHGGSAWLKTQVPVKPGSTVYLRFAIWDSGDGILDSTALVDNFQWGVDGSVVPGTGIDPEKP